MRHAPPVQVRCRGGAWRAFESLCFALATAAGLAWCLLHAGWAPGPVAAVACAAAVLTGATAWWALRGEPPLLAWDGQCWRAEGRAGQLDLMLDLGRWHLMRFRPDAGGRARWLALTAADAGPALQGFRAALYARTGAPTVQAGTSADQVLP